ncbi:penicillin acylase family protein, partial [Halochromatium sp.]
MRPRLRQLLRSILLGLTILALVLAGLLVWWLQRPHPSYDGALVLPGLEQPVTVRYGPHAVPTIQAEALGDMLFAQGFVVARERLWQMDLLRRLAGGRLAELFGPGALVSDRFYRTIGLLRTARSSFAALESEWQQLLRRYADGVNAYIRLAIDERRLPLEYQLLGLEASPWHPQDSLLVGAYMAWLNSVNLREELVFLRLSQRLGTERALELFPTDQGRPAPANAEDLPDYRLELGIGPRASATGPASHSGPNSENRSGDGSGDLLGNGAAANPTADPTARPIARSAATPAQRIDRHSALAASEALFTQPSASQGLSNAWAVTGSRTADGKALLANDPHLPAVMPSTWYELEMQAPGYQVAGGAIPGVPWILIGHNADLAWGITAAVADTQDLFVERLNDDGSAVLRPDGAWEPIRRRVEMIQVAGSAEPEQIALPIDSTGHGVLIDELVATAGSNPTGLAPIRRPEGKREGNGWRLALRLAYDQPDRSFVGFYRLNTATSLAE